VDAWEIFKLVGVEPTAEGVLKLAELIGVDDPIETLMKVNRLASRSINAA